MIAIAYTTTILRHKKIVNNIATHRFLQKDGPFAFLPISNTETSIVYAQFRHSK